MITGATALFNLTASATSHCVLIVIIMHACIQLPHTWDLQYNHNNTAFQKKFSSKQQDSAP